MIVYNVTFSVDQEIADEWLSWMKNKHVPELLKAGTFQAYKILKVLSHDDEKTFSFAVQLYSTSIEKVEQYHHSSPHPFGDKVVGFPTLLEEV